jgi:sec-independent protein translocase protein TatB
MLDVGWSEILVIALVLIIVVGPKDLPPMLRTFGRMANRLRGMANEFKGQFDQALREAELDDVRKGLGEVSKLNPANTLRDAINPIRQLGQDIKSDLQKASDEAKSAYNAPPFMKTETELAAEAAASSTASEEAGGVPPSGTADAPLTTPAAAPVMQAAVAPVVPESAETKSAPVVAAAAMPTTSVAEASAAKPKTARPRKTVSELAVASTPAEPKTKKAPVRTRDAAAAAVGAEADAKKPAGRKKPATTENAPGLETAAAAKPRKPAARKKTDTTGDA